MFQMSGIGPMQGQANVFYRFVIETVEMRRRRTVYFFTNTLTQRHAGTLTCVTQYDGDAATFALTLMLHTSNDTDCTHCRTAVRTLQICSRKDPLCHWTLPNWSEQTVFCPGQATARKRLHLWWGKQRNESGDFLCLFSHPFFIWQYSVADIATYPWVSTYEWSGVSIDHFDNLKRWLGTMAHRPAVAKGMTIPPKPESTDQSVKSAQGMLVGAKWEEQQHQQQRQQQKTSKLWA